jgi:hypothetical protein
MGSILSFIFAFENETHPQKFPFTTTNLNFIIF